MVSQQLSENDFERSAQVIRQPRCNCSYTFSYRNQIRFRRCNCDDIPQTFRSQLLQEVHFITADTSRGREEAEHEGVFPEKTHRAMPKAKICFRYDGDLSCCKLKNFKRGFSTQSR